jgi:hypothetical protein
LRGKDLNLRPLGYEPNEVRGFVEGYVVQNLYRRQLGPPSGESRCLK